MREKDLRKKQIIPIIVACSVAALAVAATVIYLALRPHDKEEFVDVKVISADGVELNLGRWKGYRTYDSEFFDAVITDMDEFLDSVRAGDFYDKKLCFDSVPGIYPYEVMYLVKDDRIFRLSYYSEGLHIRPLLARSGGHNYAESRMASVLYHAMTDTSDYVDNGTHSGIYYWEVPMVSMDDIKYLYGKLDDTLYRIDGDTVYVSCFESVFDEENECYRYTLSDGYVTRISAGKDGRILAEIVKTDSVN